MSAIFSIARREISAYFGSPLGWIILLAFLGMWGLFYVLTLFGYVDQTAQMAFSPDMADQVNVNDYIVKPFFSNLSVVAMLVTPALTMRLIAEDRKQRSIDLLLTSPIGSGTIVAGKFFGALGFVVVATLFAAHIPLTLYWLGEPDTAVFLMNYLAYVLLSGLFIASGLFFSSLTENQIVALVLSFAFNLTAWILPWGGQSMSEGNGKAVFEYISMTTHLEKLGNGTLHAESVVYFCSIILFFLFAATQRVESLRWR